MEEEHRNPGNVAAECEKYWSSPKRADARSAFLSDLRAAEEAREMDALLIALRTAKDKDALNAAAAALRTRAREALEALALVAGQMPLGDAFSSLSTPFAEALERQALLYRYLEAQVAAPYIDGTDVCGAMRELGVEAGDLLLVHSAYASLGNVLGGPQAVIAGLLDAVGEEGTLVMPALIQRDFAHAYRDWHIDRPSEVGFLTEYFRKLPGTLRSDQATHSVAAMGKYARELTKEHCAYGPRPCLFGEYAFSRSSPWQKMYDIGGKVVFLGAKANTNTFKHFIECLQVERRLDAVRDPARKRELIDGLWTFEDYPKVVAGETHKTWPMYKSIPVVEVLAQEGFVRQGVLSNAQLLCMDIRTMVRETTRVLEADLARWYPEGAVRWFRRADALAAQET